MRKNIYSSLIVFLIALPLCLGIAIASGVSPEKGIISGAIGGIVVGALGGAALQVSGPANSLIVTVAESIPAVGLTGLALAVTLAGLTQIAAGTAGAGRVAKAIPPVVTKSLLTAFAILILASQSHVMLDSKSSAAFIDNVKTLPAALGNVFINSNETLPWGAIIGVFSLCGILAFPSILRYLPSATRRVPAALFFCAVATIIATVFSLPLHRVHVPDEILDSVTLPQMSLWLTSLNPMVFELAITIFMLASAESLLSARAIDEMSPGHKSNFNRELIAQGVGNTICGLLGALPVAGVIIRSTANVASGATGRLSSVLHGVWILAMASLLPFILDDIPTSVLAAILIAGSLRLINPSEIAGLAKSDRWALPIFFATLSSVLFIDAMTGVGVGLLLHVTRKLLPTVTPISNNTGETAPAPISADKN